MENKIKQIAKYIKEIGINKEVKSIKSYFENSQVIAKQNERLGKLVGFVSDSEPGQRRFDAYVCGEAYGAIIELCGLTEELAFQEHKLFEQLSAVVDKINAADLPIIIARQIDIAERTATEVCGLQKRNIHKQKLCNLVLNKSAVYLSDTSITDRDIVEYLGDAIYSPLFPRDMDDAILSSSVRDLNARAPGLRDCIITVYDAIVQQEGKLTAEQKSKLGKVVSPHFNKLYNIEKGSLRHDFRQISSLGEVPVPKEKQLKGGLSDENDKCFEELVMGLKDCKPNDKSPTR